MAKKIFWWGNFDSKFIKAIVYGKNTPVSKRPVIDYPEVDYLMPYMDDICEYPNEAFVRKYRKDIEDYFLNGSNFLVNVVRRLEKINYGGIKLGTNEEMLFGLRQKKMTQALLDSYVQELRAAGRKMEDTTSSMFELPRTIDLTATTSDTISLYSYQEEAVSKMTKYFLEDQHKAGILAMPTGSGKTRTSVYFLLKEMVSKGYQVIWLAHRWMLLEQAAEQFYSFAPLISEENPDMENFKMVCISGNHSTVSALEKDDNLIISSVQSLCNKTMYLPNILSEKVILVIDEAHHSLAPSYRRIIKAVQAKRKDAKILGLTATPVRMTDKDTKALMHIFEDQPIYSITMSELIVQKKLAKPIPIPIETNVDIQAIIDIDEEKYIKKWGEMPESLVQKVAQTNERNDVIVNEYINNANKYGKTIIFALNAIHCDTLNEILKKRGIRCDYVYNQKSKEENQSVIERFRHNERPDGIDVLININILTEGSDIPDIQTVFLTRPTSSDVLLMQMVGRGMRGPESGGTETVNIVDFCDKWHSITKWLNPVFLLGEQMDISEPTDVTYKQTNLIPIGMIRDIAKGITYNGTGMKYKNISLPVGWFDVNDEDGNDTKILVFGDQRSGYMELEKDIQYFVENPKLDSIDIIKGYFRGLGMTPLVSDLERLLAYIRTTKEFPLYYEFSERDEIDPCSISCKIKKEDLTLSAMKDYIRTSYENHSEVVLSIFDNYESYAKRVMDYLMYEDGIVPLGCAIEEVEKMEYKLSNVKIKKSLDELLTDVMNKMKDELPENFVRPQIFWTDRDYSSYFARYDINTNQIYVNSILNSVSIEEEVIKYVIYHECIHQEIYDHSKLFREKERKYPNFQQWDNFLDYKFRDYRKDYN